MALTENLYIARQPIYNRNLKVIGYELLYRNSNVDRAIFSDGDLASGQTILNSFLHIGIDNLTGSARVFINLPEQFITSESLTPMFRENCVLEVVESVAPTEDVIAGVKRLKKMGFKIALDDFEYDDSVLPLAELADYIKVDVLDKDRQQLGREVERLQNLPARLVAEKVETQEMKQLCHDLGFDYFQGHFFCRPQTLTHRTIAANKGVVFNLMARLQRDDICLHEVERLLAQDVALSYKLLRYINSAAFTLRREIESIRDAVVLLGLDNVRNWLTLIVMTRLDDNKPRELIVIAMTRARMCELLARESAPELSRQMFIIGLFSVLDALMDQPMIELLDNLILSTPIKLALLEHSGEQGQLLESVLAYERMDPERLAQSGLEPQTISSAYIEAVKWADQSLSLLT
ncbi:HDOD domain-containing protein [Wenzhouxiangella sp. AB-CW3]|uniref:EAL and HDOD domain-containing protein n=1 Tax=Wenzhouxiangella sp. AB-CW3 TaxID=2771012 RepID=UPI00168BE44E|nr:HDOD domain-containing protein [Wenzhouxiangella sp. AB-CW3]QOC22186.1 HDOD domain-containing protein [Wenzhouxiangella sp. AB-CW3]